MITIVPYNPDWPHEFDALAAPIRRAVGRLAWSVDHIGSTAVPGLAAKDIIDIQLTVSTFNPELETALVGLGYARRTDIIADHRPPGTTGLDSDWEKWYFQRPRGSVRPICMCASPTVRINAMRSSSGIICVHMPERPIPTASSSNAWRTTIRRTGTPTTTLRTRCVTLFGMQLRRGQPSRTGDQHRNAGDVQLRWRRRHQGCAQRRHYGRLGVMLRPLCAAVVDKTTPATIAGAERNLLP